MTNLLDLDFTELQALVAGHGEPAFRADQLWQWLWQKGAAGFDEMTNLSKAFRARLADSAAIVRPRVETTAESSDGTVKFLLGVGENERIETVLIPEKDHFTQCLSTQVGCAMGCTFCSTGRLGFRRNLTQAEILGQILVAREHLGEDNAARSLRNLVFMGMGEPMANMKWLRKSLVTLGADPGLNFSPRRVTVSTVGVPGTLGEFGSWGLAMLAVSLHAPNQALRERLMPVAAKGYPLERLVADLKAFPLKPRERITIEYVLLAGVNDRPEHVRELTRLLNPLKVKVNLIACNPGPGDPYKAPAPEAVEAFKDMLWDKGVTTTIRKSKGQDIQAACGQLVAAHETA